MNILNETELVHLDNQKLFKDYLNELVKCYRHIFGGDEWREWKICKNNHKFSFKESGDFVKCPACQSEFKFYWPSEEVKNDMQKAFELPASCFVIALYDGQIVGFTYGYQMDGSKAKHHFDEHLPYKLRRLICNNGNCFWYQSDIAVDENFRKQHLGSTLYKKRMEIVLDTTKHNVFIIRSYPGAKTYHWYRKKIGYKVLTKYRRDDLNEWRYLLYADRGLVHAYIN
ncbi:GNAT family N-acetyltransferase [Candidatus Parcubacteria bacterium]|nr:GNAT family N-acetyltransferase [Patescibacteria group bacterium]MBU4482084.1 GNAT family N-acetyltransferase [Patescibacteria group bacterium]MCG2687169.1 GNAT family N-acetyltransferase [Candidatus Parcubacteria bacterium]